MPSATGRQSLHFSLLSARRTRAAGVGDGACRVRIRPAEDSESASLAAKAFAVGHLVDVGVGVV